MPATALLVLGMHRSGTSLLVRLCDLLGVDIGTDFIPADAANPRGYWEHRELLETDKAIFEALDAAWHEIDPFPDDWPDLPALGPARRDLADLIRRDFGTSPLWGVKDPRLCRLFPLWRRVLGELGIEPRPILMLRHPDEVVRSLVARDDLPEDMARTLWLRHVVEAVEGAEDTRRGLCTYEALLADWRGTMTRLGDELGVAWPVDLAAAETAVAEYLSADLRHHRLPPAECADPVSGAIYRAAAAGDRAALAAAVAAARAALPTLAPVLLSQRAWTRRRQARDARRLDGELRRYRAAKVEALRREVRGHRDTIVKLCATIGKLSTALNLPEGTLRDFRSMSAFMQAQNAEPEDRYDEWLAIFDTIGARDRAEIARLVAGNHAAGPHIRLFVLASGDPAALDATMASLDSQLYPHWEATVLTDGALAANALLHDEAADLVALVPAGDRLAPAALFCAADALRRHPAATVIYADEDRGDEAGRRSRPHFKPGWSPDYLAALNYIGTACFLARRPLIAAGGFRQAEPGAAILAAALTLATGPDTVQRLPQVLFSCRPPARPDALAEQERAAVAAHLATAAPGATVAADEAGRRRVAYPLPKDRPLVSIVIPTRDRIDLIDACVSSIAASTDYAEREIVIADNDSTDPATLAGFARLQAAHGVRVVPVPGPFDYAGINNRAEAEARGELVLFLNNDIVCFEPGWLGEMVAHAVRPEIGAVGALLYYPNDTIQHAGVILGIDIAGHAHRKLARGQPGYFSRAATVQNFSAVTAACLLVRRTTFQAAGRFDSALPVRWNDVDLCLRIGRLGYRTLWTPHARLYHMESASRRTDGGLTTGGDAEARTMRWRWPAAIADDPFYNPNLTSKGEDFGIGLLPRASRPWEG